MGFKKFARRVLPVITLVSLLSSPVNAEEGRFGIYGLIGSSLPRLKGGSTEFQGAPVYGAGFMYAKDGVRINLGGSSYEMTGNTRQDSTRGVFSQSSASQSKFLRVNTGEVSIELSEENKSLCPYFIVFVGANSITFEEIQSQSQAGIFSGESHYSRNSTTETFLSGGIGAGFRVEGDNHFLSAEGRFEGYEESSPVKDKFSITGRIGFLFN